MHFSGFMLIFALMAVINIGGVSAATSISESIVPMPKSFVPKDKMYLFTTHTDTDISGCGSSKTAGYPDNPTICETECFASIVSDRNSEEQVIDYYKNQIMSKMGFSEEEVKVLDGGSGDGWDRCRADIKLLKTVSKDDPTTLDYVDVTVGPLVVYLERDGMLWEGADAPEYPMCGETSAAGMCSLCVMVGIERCRTLPKEVIPEEKPTPQNVTGVGKILSLKTRVEPDPYSLSYKKRDLTVNPITDEVISPFDDVVFSFDINVENPEKLKEPIKIKPYLTIGTEEIFKDEFEMDFKNKKYYQKSDLFCVASGTIISCNMPVFMGTVGMQYRIKPRGKDIIGNVEVSLKEQKLSQEKKKTFAKQLLIYTRDDSFTLGQDSFLENAKKHQALYEKINAFGKLAKPIYRLEICNNSNYHTCTKETADPKVDRYVLFTDNKGGMANGQEAIYTLPELSASSHEIGHTFDLCEEYLYKPIIKLGEFSPNSWWLQNTLLKMINGYGCRNPYPKCCNDSPDETSPAYGCYYKANCPLNDEVPPVTTSNVVMGCAGAILSSNTWSVMGYMTDRTKKCVDGEVNFAYPVSVPVEPK